MTNSDPAPITPEEHDKTSAFIRALKKASPLFKATLNREDSLRATMLHSRWFREGPVEYYGIFPGEDRETTQEELNTLYGQIRDYVCQAKAEAEEQNKPLLILVGENHISRDSLLMIAMMLDICKREGITTLVDEYDPDKRASLNLVIEEWKDEYGGIPWDDVRELTYNRCYWHLTEDFKVIDCDTAKTNDLPFGDAFPIREQVMVEHIPLDNHAVGRFGAAHLQGLLERLAEKPIHAVAVRVTNDISIPSMETIDTLGYARRHFNQTSPLVKNFTLPGRGFTSAIEAIRAAEETIKHHHPPEAGTFVSALTTGQNEAVVGRC